MTKQAIFTVEIYGMLVLMNMRSWDRVVEAW